jgi:hypothetical protein
VELIGRYDVPSRRAEGEQFSDVDDLVKGAAAGMRGLRQGPLEGSGQSPDLAAETFGETPISEADTIEFDDLSNLQGLA